MAGFDCYFWNLWTLHLNLWHHSPRGHFIICSGIPTYWYTDEIIIHSSPIPRAPYLRSYYYFVFKNCELIWIQFYTTYFFLIHRCIYFHVCIVMRCLYWRRVCTTRVCTCASTSYTVTAIIYRELWNQYDNNPIDVDFFKYIRLCRKNIKIKAWIYNKFQFESLSCKHGEPSSQC